MLIRAQVIKFLFIITCWIGVFIADNLYTGWIYLSKSFMAALVFFIKKKDGSLWLVQSYFLLNVMMIKNKLQILSWGRASSLSLKTKSGWRLSLVWSLINFVFPITGLRRFRSNILILPKFPPSKSQGSPTAMLCRHNLGGIGYKFCLHNHLIYII